MSNSSTKKSVFDRIGASGSNSSVTTNLTNKSTHGFCTSFLKTGTCSLGDSCKYIHEQLNNDKSSVASKDEMRITKTTTRVVDMSSLPIKSTITVSNEQRPVVVSNSSQSTRTVVEGVNSSTTDHSQDRRLSGSDKKQVQSHSSDSKSKSSPKKKSQPSSHENRHSSNKKTRSIDSDSPVSSASDTEQSESSHKHKPKSSSHSQPSKHRKYESISPHHNDEETLNDQITRQDSMRSKSPKRTIVITERKKDETTKSSSKTSKTKGNPDIEFLGSKKVNRDQKSAETIHQQAENPKKITEIKREKKSPTKSIDRQRLHSSSANPNEKPKADRSSDQPSPSNENEKPNVIQPPSPVCVILDDDPSPPPSVEKKKTNDSEKTAKSTKRPRESDKSHSKDKTSSEHSEAKRKRLIDESSRKPTSSSKSGNDTRSTNNRLDTRRSANTSSRDESSNRKYREKTSRTSESTKDRTTAVSSSSKSRSSHDRRDTNRSSSDKKYSSNRRRKEKENVTDSEEHTDEITLPKQTASEVYMSMDWSLLSRDKRIPLNTQATSRTIQSHQHIIASERLLTNEQKQELNQIECHDLPLTQFMKQLQIKPKTQLASSGQRRFGSCAKDVIEMRHQWFIKSIEPVQQYEFINKEHYLAFQQAMNCLFEETSTNVSSTPIETTTITPTTDVLLS